MAVKKPTLREQAEKEIKRIEKTAKRISKRGYEFDLPYDKEKRRYTRKEVEELKRTKAKDIYKYSTAHGMSGEEYRRYERSQAAKKGYERRINVSISGTMIDNAMRRENWRYSDKYYEKFLDAVNKARGINLRATAEAFEEMINSGVLQPIQRHYKPEDFFFDFAEFTSYLDDIVPEEIEELREEEEEEEEDNEEFYYDEKGMIDEIFR